MKHFLIVLGWIVLVIAILFLAASFEAWLLMLLWNWVVPMLFVGAKTLTFWGAFGVMLLCDILFGSVKVITHTRR